jgi:hypothetical protein
MPRQSLPTLDAFRQWAIDCAPAAKAVLTARAFAQAERERADAYISPIFQTYQFEYGERWRDFTGPIQTVADLYLCDDQRLVAAFVEDCDRAHRAHGFTGPTGSSPVVDAERLVTEAEQALLVLAQPLFGIEASSIHLDYRAEYLELLITECVHAEPQHDAA